MRKAGIRLAHGSRPRADPWRRPLRGLVDVAHRPL